MMANRESFYLILKHINAKLYSREFQIILGFIKDYYGRDQHVQSVDRTLMVELIAGSTANDKHVDRFTKIVDEALEFDTSASNVQEVILNLKKRELGQELALAIANGKDHGELVEEYQNILKFSTLDEMLDTGVEVYDSSNIDDILQHEVDGEDRLKIYPLALNERLEGGLRPSDHLTLFARPEQGKTASVLTMAGGFARQGARGIVFNNEESVKRLYVRQISNLTGMSSREIRENPQAAKDIAEQMGFNNIMFVSLSPGTLNQIESFVEKYKPKWIIVDQLRNLAIRSESRTNQLEAAATGLRNIGKKYGVIVISVTQAGDSAEGKSVLDMGDVDYSNTGIPAQCDVLLGIGSTPEQHNSNIRVMSLCKNKVSGQHDSFPVRINPVISKYVSVKDNE